MQRTKRSTAGKHKSKDAYDDPSSKKGRTEGQPVSLLDNSEVKESPAQPDKNTTAGFGKVMQPSVIVDMRKKPPPGIDPVAASVGLPRKKHVLPGPIVDKQAPSVMVSTVPPKEAEKDDLESADPITGKKTAPAIPGVNEDKDELTSLEEKADKDELTSGIDQEAENNSAAKKTVEDRTSSDSTALEALIARRAHVPKERDKWASTDNDHYIEGYPGQYQDYYTEDLIEECDRDAEKAAQESDDSKLPARPNRESANRESNRESSAWLSGMRPPVNRVFKVDEGYGSLDISAKPISAVELRSLQEGKPVPRLDIATMTNKFLWCVLLSVDKPSLERKKDYSFTKNFKNRKGKVNGSTVKRTFKFADILDHRGGTFVVLEKSNDEGNILWGHDVQKRFTVGDKFAIISPKVIGELRSGALVVSTSLPLERLVLPHLPIRQLQPNFAENKMIYFIQKYKTIEHSMTGPVLWRTGCNGTVCDRLGFKSKNTYTCGCYFANARNDSTLRNTVVKMNFYFKDNQTPPQEHLVEDYTSLRTSKLIFENEEVSVTHKQSVENVAIRKLVAEKYYRMVDYVNDNGGWTIFGWCMRAAKEDDDDDEEDVHAFYQNIRINVSYLYPSTLKHKNIPDYCKVMKQDVENLLEVQAIQTGYLDQDNI